MEFEANIESLPAMIDFIRKAARGAKIEPQRVRKIELASEEALVNIISYAFENKEGVLSVECFGEDASLFEVVIKDRGEPFDPLKRQIELEPDKPLEDRPVGGLGIFLIQQLTDKASYEYTNGENVLKFSMKKR